VSVTDRIYGLHIGGETEQGTGRRLPLGEPATGEPLADARLATESDIDRAVSAARAAMDGDWSRTPATERSRLLHALADAIRANRGELADLEARNVGKAISSVAAELQAAVDTFRLYAAVAAAPTGRTGTLGGSLTHFSLKAPVGVCAQIVPWNYPLMLTAWKLAPALAAGCTVVLKPDPKTPITAVRLAELAVEVGIPVGVVNVVAADGPAAGAHLVRHPGVDRVAFTGSTSTGGEIMRLCSEPIKRLTLELGGKSPGLIFADADLAEAVPASVWSIYYSAGQSCEARSRLLVEQSVYDEVVARFVEAAGRLAVGDPLDRATHVGSLISQDHRRRVHGFVERAVAHGAQLVLGGEVPEGAGAFYPPTVLIDVDPRSEAAQDEIFGPVVAISPFADEREAVAIANDSRYGLMATVWTGDPNRGQRLARRIDAGTIGINMPYTAFAGVAFGGFKQSGFGRELTPDALDDYLEQKSVIVSAASRPANPFGL
jgi:acyl-CoA reductase-like NAD-dependent aldehyde dehydrogenase